MQAIEFLWTWEICFHVHNLVLLTQNERIYTMTETEQLVETVFKEIFPQYNLTLRQVQLDLAKFMGNNLRTGQILLCEAEVGTRQTHLLFTYNNAF